ncbi:MAG TPA: alkaline phosphatase family protein [Candidatus Sulfotelmatobacter sp.]|nr:alkaline phosphatase family protein [Candidatus Sulfotelmatobacter sp.]
MRLGPISLLSLASALLMAGCGGGTGNSTSTPPPNPSPAPTPPPAAGITSVNHVVIMLQENRSFDHYFGQMTAYRQANSIPINGSPATIDDESTGSYSNYSPVTGGNIAAYHTGSVCTEDLTPDWSETHENFNWENPSAANSSSPMDGFAQLAVQVSQYASTLGINMADQDGHRVMGYFDGNDLNYYYFMASNFGIDDHFFSPVPSYSPAQRAYLFAATSQGYVHDPGAGKLTAKTIWQELDAAGQSWKIYSEEQNLYSYLQEFAYYNQPGVSAKVVSINQFFTDAANGQLPAVSYIETGLHDGLSEHTSNFDPANPQQGEVPINVQTGAQYAAKIINAVMQGPSWTDSVIFFAHDEGGGFFDHVPPLSVPSPDGIKPLDLTSTDVTGDFTITGSRVPNMVISPFAKKNFVSHTPMDYTAFLRFIETRWNLPTLTARDAAMPDMTEFFDFTNKPWSTAPSPPAQNMSGTCDFTKE